MFRVDIKKLTKENTNFRKVLYTGEHCQIVAMSIAVGSEIGSEVHHTTDQILFFVDGKADVTLETELRVVEKHDVVFVPAGTLHNVKNSGDQELKLFTVYAPPAHPDGTIQKTKDAAE